MPEDIVIVPEGDHYFLLHGRLHLANLLAQSDSVAVEVRGLGIVTIVKTRSGLLVNNGQERRARQLV